MKFALNGAITIGTLDGANIEILEEVGEDNIFIFGLTADDVVRLRRTGYAPSAYISQSPLLQKVLNLLEKDFFSPSEPGLFRPIYNDLMGHDPYCLLADFDAYIAAQAQIEDAYRNQKRWTRMSILNVARCSKFSSDRTIKEYASAIWKASGLAVPIDRLRN